MVREATEIELKRRLRRSENLKEDRAQVVWFSTQLILGMEILVIMNDNET